MSRLDKKEKSNDNEACCDVETRDIIYLAPNFEAGFRHENILQQIKDAYVEAIGIDSILTKENNKPLIIKFPAKEEQALKILVKKKFIIENKGNFLNLLKKLISEKIADFIRGSISYDESGEHTFINLHSALNSESIPIMRRICFNYDNIKCLFKHKNKDIVTLFCKTKSRIRHIDETCDEVWNYLINYAENGNRENTLTNALVIINGVGNVKIYSSSEKFNILIREIYAKNLDEGLDILRNEMKNLGFNIKVAEKTKIRERKDAEEK